MTPSESSTVPPIIKRLSPFSAVRGRPAPSLYPHALLSANVSYLVPNINVSKLVTMGIVPDAKRKSLRNVNVGEKRNIYHATKLSIHKTKKSA